MILLTSAEARRILAAGEDGECEVSTDLGVTTESARVAGPRVTFESGESLDRSSLQKVAKDEAAVFEVRGGAPVKLILYSEATSKTYKLRPTPAWPAMEISGILMHRVKDIDPETDARNKVRALGRGRGRLLDTCCGLGYTAIVAAAAGFRVTTFEVDPSVLELARRNPWSAPLFEGEGIELREGSVLDGSHAFGDGTFRAVLHDPPTVQVAGELYSDAFYGELSRLLAPGGVLFHYTGSPGSRYRGADLPARVARRLRYAGFERVETSEPLLGVLAVKGHGGRGAG